MLGKRTMLRTRSSLWRMAGKSPEVKRGRLLYILDTVPPDPMGEQLILRIPRSSKLVPRLDALVPRLTAAVSSARGPGTRRSAHRPGRG